MRRRQHNTGIIRNFPVSVLPFQLALQADGDRHQRTAYLGGGLPTDDHTPLQGGGYLVGSFGIAGTGSAYLSIFHAELEARVAEHASRARPTRPLYQIVQTDQRVWRWERDGESVLVPPCLPDYARGLANAVYSVLGQLREYQDLFWYLCGGEPERLLLPGASHRHSRAVNPLDRHYHFHEGPCQLEHRRYDFGPLADEFYRAKLSGHPNRLVSIPTAQLKAYTH
jgi:hypothetical protein